jgi:hypothetical protein
LAGIVELSGIEGIDHEPAPAFEGGILDTQGHSTDDLGYAHFLELRFES